MNHVTRIATLLLLGLLVLAQTSLAASKFISEEFEVPLRTGPGGDRKIIALIPTGRSVDVVTPGDEWTEVSMSNGKQGWLLSRYLTDKEPAAVTLERLQQRLEKLTSQNQTLQQKSSESGSDNKRLGEELATAQQALKKLTDQYETLKTESADFLKLKTKYENTVKELSETRAKAEKFESQVHSLSSNEFNKGMLYGGGLLVFGCIAGYILKRPKRRAPLM